MSQARTAADAPATGRRSWTFPICLGVVLGGSLLVTGLNFIYWHRLSGSSRAVAMGLTDTVWGFVAIFVLLAAVGRVWVVMRRELVTYFQSPLVYLLAALFNLVILLIPGLRSLEAGPKMALPGIVFWSVIVMIVMVPILTMRLLADEKATGTMEILVTDPVTDWDIVLGKFMAGVLALWAMIAPLVIYLIIFALVGRSTTPAALEVAWYKLWKWPFMVMEWGPIFTGFAGLGLLGVLFVSMGLFASSLTSNQAISALVGIVMILVLCALGLLQQFFDGTKAHDLIRSLSLFDRIDMMIRGRFDTRSIFLFLSTTVLMLYLSVRVVESRKWR